VLGVPSNIWDVLEGSRSLKNVLGISTIFMNFQDALVALGSRKLYGFLRVSRINKEAPEISSASYAVLGIYILGISRRM
jgi:hypothetical protein